MGEHPDAGSPLAHFPGGLWGVVRAAAADDSNDNDDDETPDDREPGPGA